MSMRQTLLFLALLVAGCARSQQPFTAAINYVYATPSGAPSQSGSRLRINLTNGTTYMWNPTTLDWVLQPRGIDELVGCADPAYTPGYGQSDIVINKCDPPQIFYYYAGDWHESGGGGLATVSTDSTLSGNGGAGTPLKIAQRGATSGQVLKWDGTTWRPAADAGGATDLSFVENTTNDITINSSTGSGFNFKSFGGLEIYEESPGTLGIDGSSKISGLIANQQIGFGVSTALNGSNNLTWNGSGVTVTKSAIGGGVQPITNGLILDNPTNAGNLSQQKSPPIVWRGNGWKTTATAASQPVRFIADVLPVQGTSAPSATWRLSSSINGAAFGDRLAVTSGGFCGIGTIVPRRTLEVNGNLLFTGNVYDNQDNGLMIQSAAGVTSNRDFTFGNTTYGRYLVTFKNFSFSTTGAHPALGAYLYYVNGETYTSASVPPSIYFRGYQAQAASNTRGGDFIIDLPAGDGTGRRGAVGIGTATVDNSAVVDITSTTAGVLFPRMTTTQRDAIPTAADGLVIFNTTDTKLQVRAGGVWIDLH